MYPHQYRQRLLHMFWACHIQVEALQIILSSVFEREVRPEIGSVVWLLLLGTTRPVISSNSERITALDGLASTLHVPELPRVYRWRIRI